MKKFLKIAAVVFGILLLIIAGVATWVNFSAPKIHSVSTFEVKSPMDSLSLARGGKIVETICAYCHRSDNGILEGKMFAKADSPFGELWSGNITNHPTKGLGRYSDGELAYLLRTGIKKDGHFAGPFMPFVGLADEDLASVIAYLRSGSPSSKASEATHVSHPSFLLKALYKFGAISPLPYDGKPIEAPAPSDELAYGRYLATAVYQCYDCHSGSFETNNPFEPESSPRYFGGGNLCEDPDFNVVPSPNITPHPELGIGQWSEADFYKAIKGGIRPDGTALSVAMPRFALLDSVEVKAIWSYLRTVPALGDPVAVAGN